MIYGIEYFGFIYKWTNKKNGKYYIGSHHGAIDDGYIGSGIWFKRAYNKNPELFTREILEYITVNNIQITVETEQRYLTEICEVGNKSKCYNISRTAGGGYVLYGKTQEEIEQIYETISTTLKNKTAEEKLEALTKARKTIASNPEKYARAIEKGKETKRKWTHDRKKLMVERMKNTLANNPEIQERAAKQRAGTIASRTEEEKARVKLNQSGPWPIERKEKHKESLRIKNETRTQEEKDIVKFNRSQAQLNRKK